MPSRHLRRPSHGSRRSSRHVTGALFAITALAASGLSVVTGPATAASSGALPARTGRPAGAAEGPASAAPAGGIQNGLKVRAAVLAQTLVWQPCLTPSTDPGLPAAYYRIRCTTMSVPMDWEDLEDARLLRIDVTRLPATTQPAAGVLFTNPGGPGAAGADLPLMFLGSGRKALLRTQDIYGMDVRGSGGSSNATCGGSTLDQLDPRDRSARHVDLMLDAAQLQARACAVAGGDLMHHLTTAQTVRDLDLLRGLIGADKVNWLGYSAGTWLGAQYATTYPDRVGRMVLDSNTDFTTDWQTAFSWQAMGFERRFRQDFLPWAAANDATFRLGRTPEDVRVAYERIRAAMAPDAPVASAVGLDQLIATTMYDGSMFPIAAEVLAGLKDYVFAARAGDAKAMKVAAGAVRAAYPLPVATTARRPMSSDSSNAAFYAIACNDTPWTLDRASLAERSRQAGEAYPLIGWSTIFEPCAFWDRPQIRLPVPTGLGLPPVLMVQSEHDPATPIEGARDAAEHFSAAQLLTVTGSGDHGLYGGYNGCVNRAVEAYLISGTLPGPTCPGRALPGPAQGLSAQSLRAAASGSAAPAGSSATAGLPAPGTNPLIALEMITARLGTG
jgi:pimeloyl-ACP methyl ester carboxylesterase